MNKKDIKKEYENIKITPNEKVKILNNIMNKRKKKNVWLPVLGFGCLAACCAGFVIINPLGKSSSSNGNNPISNILDMDSKYSLETNYRREIIINAKEYMKQNNIDVDDLSNEITEIDTTKIIDDEQYNMCSGNLIIKKKNGVVTYSTSVDCGSNSDGEEVEFRLYDGNLKDVIKLDSGMVIVSNEYTAYSPDEYSIPIGYNVLFTYCNEEGEEVWSTLYDVRDFDDDNKPANAEVLMANYYNDKLYLIIKVEHGITYNPDGSSYSSVSLKSVIINKKGKITKNDNIYVESNLLYGGIPIDDNHMYAYPSGGVSYIMEFVDGKYEFYLDEKLFDSVYDDETDVSTNFDVITYNNGRAYGLIKSKGWGEKYVLEMNTLCYKDVKNPSITKKVEVGPVESDFIHDIKIIDDRLYVLSMDNVYQYDLELNFIRKIEVDKVDGEDDWLDTNILVDGDNLIYNKRTQEKNAFFSIDKEGKTVESTIVDINEIRERFGSEQIIANFVENGKLTQAYATSSGILLIINK